MAGPTPEPVHTAPAAVDGPLRDQSHAPTAPLDPTELSPHAREAINLLARQATPHNSARSYRTAISYVQAWYSLRYGQPLSLPLSESVVLQFVLDHVARPGPQPGDPAASALPPAVDARLVELGLKARPGALSISTVRHRLAVISSAHTRGKLPNPVATPAVLSLFRNLKRVSPPPPVRPHLNLEHMKALLATCDDSLAGIRDRALLLFAFATGGRRRSEVTFATMENCTRQQDGTYLFHLARSKTNQTGDLRPRDIKVVPPVAAAALTAWLAAARITSGPIFRQVNKAGRVGLPLKPQAINLIVQARARLADLGDLGLTAHSIRAGFVTEAEARGLLESAMAASGHTSRAGVAPYIRPDATAPRTLDSLLSSSPTPEDTTQV